MMTLYISELIEEAIDRAASEAQAYLEREEDKLYKVEDLKQAFIFWLEISLEQLANDAMFHAFEGMDCYTFNRHTFTERLNKLQPSVIPLSA